MTKYRAYWTLAEDGHPVTPRHLEAAAASINAKVNEKAHEFAIEASLEGAIYVATHLGLRCLRMEARSAYEARQNLGYTRKFLRDAGYDAHEDMTSLTSRAVR